jgi:hypothetical protein
MRRIVIIIIILIISHLLFFITVDRNRAAIKSFMVKSGLWNSSFYIYFQEKLTNKRAKSESEDSKFYSDLPKKFSTNHFDENHEIFDLEKILIQNNENLNIGYITSLDKKEKIIRIISNNGYIFFLKENFKFIKYQDLSKHLKNFYTDFAYGGIRGGKWIDKKNLIIFTTTKKNGIYKLSLISIKINEQYSIKINDVLDLEDLPNQDGTTSNLGGGIEYKDNKIYLTIGTGATPNQYEINDNAQNDKKNLGKILEITLDKNNKFNKIKKIAKGTRNSQGLLIVDNTLISVEHGPQGGDEINVINLEKKNYANLGWPKFSYGLPYHNEIPYADTKTKNKNVKKDIDRYYNDEQDNFLDPIFYFTPSIAISHIAKCPFFETNFSQYKNCFIISSLKDKSFYVIKYQKNEDNIKIKSTERINVSNRIRKIYTELNTIYICLDNLKIIKIKYNIFN